MTKKRLSRYPQTDAIFGVGFEFLISPEGRGSLLLGTSRGVCSACKGDRATPGDSPEVSLASRARTYTTGLWQRSNQRGLDQGGHRVAKAGRSVKQSSRTVLELSLASHELGREDGGLIGQEISGE